MGSTWLVRAGVACAILLILGGCATAHSGNSSGAGATTASTTNVSPDETLNLLPFEKERVIRIEAFRVESEMAEVGSDSTTIGGYPVLSSAVILTARQQSQLSVLLKNPLAYWGPENWCGFSPGVAFRIRSDKHLATMLVCFQCCEFTLRIEGQEEIVRGNFIGMQPRMLDFVKGVFPGDPEIQVIPCRPTYARIYDAPAGVEAWYEPIQDAVGEPEEWMDGGGSKHFLNETPDGIVVLTTAAGHARIRQLSGIHVRPDAYWDKREKQGDRP